ncbi:FAD-binding protein [Scandinavium lactucae]|uniref:FAD-binding protein n=1 Tax=Scandinavium lactucae TaxID=3095028 RepID=A0ABU4QTA8_9ENTR|nr:MULTISPECIES: FAD-binding protein [unclassified Scandinavium]MDX6041727.1 FAD-binding protein [Scandinavium sp. V105_6]MDX6051360.1 FAD-binding protein [Scandinavium sp. V105_1]
MMKIAVVLLNAEDEGPLADFLSRNGLRAQTCWRVNEEMTTAEAVLPALEAAYWAMPVEMLLFPASPEGDELATRLAWRLNGSAICQALDYDNENDTVSKAVYGNALTARLRPENRPVCLSLSGTEARHSARLPASLAETHIVPVAFAEGLSAPNILSQLAHPLQSARIVLAVGQGAVGGVFGELAEALNAELGFTRQRVMAGGCDEQRMLGISGQRVAPEVCLIAGASGASAFMAGVSQSRFIVAINTDAAAPVFAAADVGIVGDAQGVLQILAECASAN